MSADLREGILNAVIRSVTAAVTGGGVWQLSGGAWFGEVIFNSFGSSLSVNVQGRSNINNELYGNWASHILQTFGQQADLVAVAIFLPILLLLIAHVVFKHSLPMARQPTKKNGSRIRFYLHFYKLYVRFYFVLSAVVLLVLAAAIFLVWDPFWLIGSFVLLVVPAVVYLIYYSKDLLQDKFSERFSYVCVLLVLGIAFFALPNVYGARAFDLSLYRVLNDDSGSISTPYITLSFDDSNATLCRIFFIDDVRTIEIKQLGPAAHVDLARIPASLRDILKSVEPPQSDDSAKIIGQFYETAVGILGARG